MNAFQAFERLNLLKNSEMPLERAIRSTREYGDALGTNALKVILKDLMKEKNTIESKLKEFEL